MLLRWERRRTSEGSTVECNKEGKGEAELVQREQYNNEDERFFEKTGSYTARHGQLEEGCGGWAGPGTEGCRGNVFNRGRYLEITTENTEGDVKDGPRREEK